jgi:hypothetical protein
MLCAGIDVSKPHLDLALVSTTAKPTRLRFPNTPEGRQALLAALAHHRPTWVALEPTGAYHLPLLQLLAEKGLQIALVNPYHLAAFRRATGERHKTDRQDALLLARYAQVCGESLRAYTLPPKPSRSSRPWWATGRTWPRGKGPSSTSWRRPAGRERGDPRSPPEGAGLRGGAPGGGGSQNPGPPAPPAPLGKGQGGGRLRGVDPRAGGVGEERGEESAIPEGASPFAKEAFHGSLGGGAARPGDGGLLPSPALPGEAQKAGPGGRGPQAS